MLPSRERYSGVCLCCSIACVSCLCGWVDREWRLNANLCVGLWGSKQQSVIQQLQARNGRLIVMCCKGDRSLTCPNSNYPVIEVPRVQDCLQPIINIVPLQVGSALLPTAVEVAPSLLVLLPGDASGGDACRRSTCGGGHGYPD